MTASSSWLKVIEEERSWYSPQPEQEPGELEESEGHCLHHQRQDQ